MKQFKATYPAIIRFIIYGLLMAALNLVFRFDAGHPSEGAKFGEASVTEMVQELFLFLMSGIFLFAGLKGRDYRPFTNLLACFFFASFIREFNNTLSYWFYLVIPVLLGAVYLFIRDIKKIPDSAGKFFAGNFTAYFLIGMITTYIFSRLFGKTDFWQMIMEESYSRYAKNAGEECIELLGYSFLLISAIEFYLFVNKSKRTVP